MQKPADFRSDTLTQPTAAMREVMAAAPLGDDVYGEDPSVNALQEYAADLLGFEAALFAPSGTMTNLLGLMAHCSRGEEVLCGQQWHTYRWEAGGMAVLGSIQPQPLANEADGTIALAALEAAIKPDDSHHAITRLIAMENTTGGRLLPLGYLQQVHELATRRGLATHLDGARLFNAATAHAEQTGTDVYAAAKALCVPFDSVSVCLSKGLGAPIGSLLLGSAALVARAKRLRKMLGGGMRQAGMLAAAGQHALQHHVRRLAADHALAHSLVSQCRSAVAENPHLNGRLQMLDAHTNIAFSSCSADLGPALSKHLQACGVRANGGPFDAQTWRFRWVAHLDVGPAEVAQAAAALRSFGT